MVEDLVDRSISPLETALKDAKLSKDKIDDILLVGGQTRMPLVQKKVQDFFWKRAAKRFKP